MPIRIAGRNFALVRLLFVPMRKSQHRVHYDTRDSARAIAADLFTFCLENFGNAMLKRGIANDDSPEAASDHIELGQEFTRSDLQELDAIEVQTAIRKQPVLYALDRRTGEKRPLRQRRTAAQVNMQAVPLLLRVVVLAEVDTFGAVELPQLSSTGNEVSWVVGNELRHADILLNEGQSLELVGRPAMYRGEVPGSCFQNTLVRFRAAEGVDPRYALGVFLSYLHNMRFQRIAKWTTNIAHLGAERFAELEFPLPPLFEQIQIAEETDDRLSILRKMTSDMKQNADRADRLRQSILKRGFEGALVPQDRNDEPASVLLERIRAERARIGAKATSGKRAGRNARRKNTLKSHSVLVS